MIDGQIDRISISQTGTYAAGTEVEWKAYDESGHELDADVKPADK